MFITNTEREDGFEWRDYHHFVVVELLPSKIQNWEEIRSLFSSSF